MPLSNALSYCERDNYELVRSVYHNGDAVFSKYGYLNLRGPDVLVILLVVQEAPPPASQLAMFVPKLQS